MEHARDVATPRWAAANERLEAEGLRRAKAAFGGRMRLPIPTAWGGFTVDAYMAAWRGLRGIVACKHAKACCGRSI